jgi:hypothetical protein
MTALKKASFGIYWATVPLNWSLLGRGKRNPVRPPCDAAEGGSFSGVAERLYRREKKWKAEKQISHGI